METKAEQYYPTYNFKERDILLLEFDEAQKIANGQAKVYAQMANIVLVIVTFISTVSFESEAAAVNVFFNSLEGNVVLTIVFFLSGLFLLRYFVDLQKQITINARKVVTLRTLLGLDYGHIHLTLPNWRVEGATNPFAIRFFHGWLSYRTMPFWLITLFMNWIWLKSIRGEFFISISQKIGQSFLLIAGIFAISSIYTWSFRINLNDRHETFYLNLVKMLAKILRIQLLENFEYLLYRAKLAKFEIERLEVDLGEMLKILIQIEDKSFDKHPGVSFRALVRGFLSRFSFSRRHLRSIPHGGSTITMQLARSLFIPMHQSKYKRKVIEILLAFWLRRQFDRNDLLKIYLCSVRYERNVIGLANGIKYFLGSLRRRKLSNEEAFFLVERLSNIGSTVSWSRVQSLKSRLDVELDETRLRQIYRRQVNYGLLRNTGQAL